jgi:hypothetical protein
MKENNFAEHQPCHILLVEDEEHPTVLTENDGKTPRVFERYTKARKFAANSIEPKYHPFLQYVNVVPLQGSGDREETNNRKCLKCDGFLRMSGEDSKSKLGTGDVVAIETMDCPSCDLGEE